MGTAMGAGAAALSFIVGTWLSDSSDNRRFVVSTSIGGEDQAILIAAAGKCVGHFTAETTSHSFQIAYPMRELSKRDIACILTEAGPSKHDTFVMRVR